MMVGEAGTWMSPAVFPWKDNMDKALTPLEGKRPEMGLVGRLFFVARNRELKPHL